jgi:hypothetical protein
MKTMKQAVLSWACCAGRTVDHLGELLKVAGTRSVLVNNAKLATDTDDAIGPACLQRQVSPPKQ